MENDKLIRVDTLVQYYEIDQSFFNALKDFGLIEIIDVENTPCIERESLGEVERVIRLHYDLDINLAGIDAIANLLLKIREMQAELNLLRSRLGNEAPDIQDSKKSSQPPAG